MEIKFTPVSRGVTALSPNTPAPTRKPRSDKRVRSTLKISVHHDGLLKAVAYNQSETKQDVMDRILKLVLENDEVFAKLLAGFPKGAQRHPYLVMRD